MEELSSPVIGIALVLSSVFVPTGLIPGITGRLYQQFALTIAISVVFSAFNALTLSPALASLLLRPKKESRGLLRRFFDWFNRSFGRGTDLYVRVCAGFLRKGALAFVVIAAFAIGAVFFGNRLPTSFLPDEDQGYVYINMQLPNAASQERTAEASRDVEKILSETPGIQYYSSVIGFSLLSYVRTSYNAFYFNALVRICAGGDQQWSSLPRQLPRNGVVVIDGRVLSDFRLLLEKATYGNGFGRKADTT